MTTASRWMMSVARGVVMGWISGYLRCCGEISVIRLCVGGCFLTAFCDLFLLRFLKCLFFL